MARTDVGTYVDRESPDKTYVDNEYQNICGQRRPRSDFGTCVNEKTQNKLQTYVSNEAPEQTSKHMSTTKAQNRTIIICAETVQNKLRNNEGPEQTSEHMWTEKAQNSRGNICGQRRHRRNFGTYVNREDPDKTSENVRTEKAQNRLRNIFGQRRPRTDFGIFRDRDDPVQTSEHMWITKVQNRFCNIC